MAYQKNWNEVYALQDILLQKLSPVDEIFLAGGTAIQRFVLSSQQRESDDLDFFLPVYYGQKSQGIVRQIRTILEKDTKTLPAIQIENYIDNSDGVYRFFCTTKEIGTPVKLEILDCTADRFLDTRFITTSYFPKIENRYNLILYKLKALCDRQDTIKDLFDLYFLFKEASAPINQKTLFLDLQMKFAEPTGYLYNQEHVFSALQANYRKWDIVLMEHLKPVLPYLKEAINSFQEDLKTAISSTEITYFDLSYATLKQKEFLEIPLDDYYNFIEPNVFIEQAYKKWVTNQAIITNFLESNTPKSKQDLG